MAIAEKYQRLFEPGTIGGMRVKNRLVMAPMAVVGLLEIDGMPSQRAIDYYEERARGGVGLIITGATWASSKVEPLWDEGKYFPFPRMDSATAGARLNYLAERIHYHDCKLCLQLTAGLGRGAGPAYLRGQPVSASAIRAFWQPEITARPLTIQEIEELVGAFGTAAGLARSAGVDAIELNCHEGHLFDQFMTSLWNKRNDKYGGATLRERMTFPMEVVESINRATQGTLPIIFRFALTHKIPGGRSEEEGLELCRFLEEAGIAALHIDGGCYDNWYWPHPPIYQPPGCMLDLAFKAKQAVKKVPIMCAGKMHYPDLAEEALEQGKADFVVIGRGLLADPEFPNKTRRGAVQEIKPCIGCHEGCLSRCRRQSLSCAVNPACGDEKAWALTPVERKRRVVVVGGGPAGMEAARIARLRGHQVTLFEKSARLGGKLAPASVPVFKQDLRRLMEYYVNQMRRLKVELIMNTEATADSIREAKPDVVFLATGAVPRIPTVPGIANRNVATAIDVLEGKARVGKNALVVGGGMVGCEVAAYLAQKGTRVTVIEMLPQVLSDMFHVHANREMLLKMLREGGVAILPSTALSEVTARGVKVIDSSFNSRTIPADSVIIATGFAPLDGLYDELSQNVDEVHKIGDCVASGSIIDAVWQAYGKARLV